MGIENIQILIQPDFQVCQPVSPALQVQAAQQALVEAHRRGEHPYGSMIRACPLCQRGS